MKTELKKAEEENVKAAAKLLLNGGIVVFPTETVYGIAALAKDETAVKKIFEIKGRDENKPLSIFISSASKISEVAKITSESEKIFNKLSGNFWPGPLTMILPKRDIIPDIVTAHQGTVGVRIPADLFALALARTVDEPIVVTSANISGHEPAKDFEKAVEIFTDKVDMIVDGGSCGSGTASTVIEINDGDVFILREGEISKENISRLSHEGSGVK